MEDKELTELVLEGLKARIQEQSFAREIQTIQQEITELDQAKKKIELGQRQCIEAKGAAIRASDTAKQLIGTFEAKVKEVNALAERITEAVRSANEYTKVFEQKIDFNTVLAPLNEKIGEAQAIHSQMMRISKEISLKKQQLKNAGIDVDTVGKTPSRISL